MTEHRVAVVLHASGGAVIETLAPMCHVWAVKSPENATASLRFYNTDPIDSDPLESGVTIFDSLGEDPEDALIRILDTIEDHHSEYAHKPGLSVLEVHGVALTPRLRAELQEWGYSRFERRDDSFVTHR